jgi:hypothetical protein
VKRNLWPSEASFSTEKNMRAVDLLPPILNERHSLRRHRRRGARAEATAPHVAAPATDGAIQAPSAPSPPSASEAPYPAPTPSIDPAVERVRRAGGPIDNACYSCSCGLVFAAAVSTTVSCPRCGADQGW